LVPNELHFCSISGRQQMLLFVQLTTAQREAAL
jgi:hypothetical protein